MKYVTVAEMKAIDRAAIEERGIPAERLMENAGRKVADEALDLSPRGSVAIFCGYGNNGGDGFVGARLLIQAGISVEVFLVGNPKKFSPETESNFNKLATLKCLPAVLSSLSDIDKISGCIKGAGVIVDAIFGIGINGMLDSFYTHLIETINSLGRPVISVDIPSGLNADTGEPLPTAVRAAKTVTMGYPKVGFRSPAAKEYIGEVIVADIGL